MRVGVVMFSFNSKDSCFQLEQVAYQKLDGIVFNILNQTKMLFTALFVFLIVGSSDLSFETSSGDVGPCGMWDTQDGSPEYSVWHWSSLL